MVDRQRTPATHVAARPDEGGGRPACSTCRCTAASSPPSANNRQNASDPGGRPVRACVPCTRTHACNACMHSSTGLHTTIYALRIRTRIDTVVWRATVGRYVPHTTHSVRAGAATTWDGRGIPGSPSTVASHGRVAAERATAPLATGGWASRATSMRSISTALHT